MLCILLQLFQLFISQRLSLSAEVSMPNAKFYLLCMLSSWFWSQTSYNIGRPRNPTETRTQELSILSHVKHQNIQAPNIPSIESYHTAVQILLHLAEGVWRSLSFAWNNDADVGDGQSSVRLALRCPPVGDIDALGGVSADVGRATRGGCLDKVAALL